MNNLSEEKQKQLQTLIEALQSMPTGNSQSNQNFETDYDDFDVNDYDEDVSDYDEDVIDNQEDFNEAMENIFNSPEFQDMKEEVKERKSTERQSTQPDVYSKNKVKIGEKIINFETPDITAEWGDFLKLSLTADDKLANLESLISLVTQDAIQMFGDASRIRTLAVSDSRLIINNVLFAPKLNYDPETIKKFPMDTWRYIRSGCIAPFLDWGILLDMGNLKSIAFDDSNFVITYVADGVGLGRKFGASSLFRICPSLEELWIEEDLLTKDGKATPSSNRVKEKIGRGVKISNIMDGFNFNLYNGTNGFQNYATSSLTNYARSRGDKNLFRFTGGVIARAGLAGGATTVNAGVHLIGGTLKAIGHVFKDAITPYKPEE